MKRGHQLGPPQFGCVGIEVDVGDIEEILAAVVVDLLEEISLLLGESERRVRDAVARYRHWAAKWQEPAASAVTCLAKDMDELLPFLDCPSRHWKKVRTTNAIERAFREVRRRTRPMSCFQNPASVDRIIYAVANHMNNAWKEKPLPQFTHLS